MTSAGSICIAGVVVLESPRAVDPQKGIRHVVFDANFCVIQETETVTLSLLRYFASMEMATQIQKMADKPFQKAFVVANIASPVPNSISTDLMTSGYQPSDYAFVGDIHQLIPIEGDVDMETNPYITATGTVTSFDTENHTFAMTPNQYIVLTHSSLPFPINAHFANSESKKRWGSEGPKVTVGSTITFGGLLQRVVCERNINKKLERAEVEVTSIAYFGTRGNLTASPARLENQGSGLRRQWNWDSIRKSSLLSQPGQPSTSTSTGEKRKRSEELEEENEIKREKTANNKDED